MSKEANNYTTKSNSTPLPTGKGGEAYHQRRRYRRTYLSGHLHR